MEKLTCELNLPVLNSLINSYNKEKIVNHETDSAKNVGNV